MNRIVLGRGIGALIPESPNSDSSIAGAQWAELPVDKVLPNPSQPRKDMNESSLLELSESIRRDGVLQPILVQIKGEGFELIAGERRLRAAKLAGLSVIPARVFDVVDEQQRAVLALVENLQREDLSPLEEAQGYVELRDKYGLSQESLADAVGKDRSTVANTMRILNLPEKVKTAIANRKLTAGHGRALLRVAESDKIEAIAKRAINEGWSVRRVEQEVSGKTSHRGRPMKRTDTNRWTTLEDALKRKFGTQVSISHRLGKGKIVFDYYSDEDLTRLVDLFEVRLD
jgi:ParB family chromosome partitioning protein